jgi:hypothetical protein
MDPLTSHGAEGECSVGLGETWPTASRSVQTLIEITLVDGRRLPIHAGVTTRGAALREARTLNDIVRTHRDNHR